MDQAIARTLEHRQEPWAYVLSYKPKFRTGSVDINTLSYEEAIMLDFSFPPKPNKNYDSKLQVFHPDGGNARYYPVTKQEWEDFLSVSDSQGYIFTIGNRIEGLGTDKPELIAVIESIKEEACLKKMSKAYNVSLDVISQYIPSHYQSLYWTSVDKVYNKFEITTLPYIEVTEGRYGCLKKGKGKYLFFKVIKEF